ncbi:hypothetical protein RRG08_052663 [Elysia crispata]|uniref:Uncharacterized protein n=1 Tax=Elysia crispata TaxID=231223 RepID=A0AAE0ZW17_9GAST|nr:hypothetical protein RRG08_052663 [Elysia crispata]
MLGTKQNQSIRQAMFSLPPYMSLMCKTTWTNKGMEQSRLMTYFISTFAITFSERAIPFFGYSPMTRSEGCVKELIQLKLIYPP